MAGLRGNQSMESDGSQEDILDRTLQAASKRLLSRRHSDGHWAYELEADVTISAEYIILNHFLGEIDDDLEAKLANYIRRIQSHDGGWPLYAGGDFNISSSVKAYFALKLAGDGIESPHMCQAKEAILAHGGAVNCNVFTRITLALFKQIPWRAAPVSRVEILLAPTWFPIHINKVSYWTRTVTVPLLILTARKPVAENPRRIGIDELFHKPPYQENYRLTNPTGSWIGGVMLVMDRIFRPLEPLIPSFLTNRAIQSALSFVEQRLNGEDGLGGIFPAMANALMVFNCLGYEKDDPRVAATRKAIDGLIVATKQEAYCQPCLSPVWDTSLAAHAVLEADPNDRDVIRPSLDWLKDLQILDTVGDWTQKRKSLRPGGWAFQYRNDYYPDVDDTAVVAMAMHRSDPKRYGDAIARAVEWIAGMQCANGGWAAFDAENEYYLLDNMPFADHGALLDPPTSDVTARCVGFLSQVNQDKNSANIKRGITFLKSEQEEDGSWFGRWGTNYIYGTWSVLCALNAAKEDMAQPYIRKAVDWLKARQRDDGGWGEDCATYWEHRKNTVKDSMPSQTAWALLALIAAGEIQSAEVARGIQYLLDQFDKSDGWEDTFFNAVGFPRVFYLKYHGYSDYFPLMALARYSRLKKSNFLLPEYGL